MSQTGAIRAGSTGVLETPMGEDEGIDFEIIELLFFAYRDFISDPDAILDTYGFGRAHHRVVHFVNREPGLTVAALLETLKITKQSLARVLKQLIDSGYIEQVAGPEDRRQRRLFPTQRGRELALALARPQSRRIANALENLDAEGRKAVSEFLSGMIEPGTGSELESRDSKQEG
ncbi:Transcriptional regulator [Hoeflea phototrophica DFL-43]|uniref:Transcriptional regulator n=1 Tax=Hoeflea phototrophica (strain DSM 17068 / NCIMB 14078 / DFL-43) TaxID=411684 RepID=A9DH45_HOEPD|nr:MarR family transcriptional regulator [Hoeflea phototrophica]EDQ31477.1 Transcriptional regulator [Hoeflea phototrophica DFL-43]